MTGDGWRGFNSQFKLVAKRLGREPELAFTLNAERARLAGALVRLDRDPKVNGNRQQSFRPLGVVFIVLHFPGRAVRHLALMLRKQAAADVGGNLLCRFGFRDINASLGCFALTVIGPMVAQCVRQAGGDVQVPALASVAEKQPAASGQGEGLRPMLLITGGEGQCKLGRHGFSEGCLFGRHEGKSMAFVVYVVNDASIDSRLPLLHAIPMKKPKTKSAVEFTDTVSSIFTARRDLMFGAKWTVEGSGFTVEEADLLVSLYGAKQLGWDDLEHDPEGFVGYKRLEQFLVHNPSLLSRRIIKLAGGKPPLVEVAGGDRTAGQHFNSKRVRITPEGIRRIEPVWRRFQKMSAALLQDVPIKLREDHYELNTLISQRIRERREGLQKLFESGQ